MMDKEKAGEIIERLLSAIQKYRSNAQYELDSGELMEVSKQVQPYSLGDDFLPILIKMVDGKMAPLDFYNVMVIATMAPEMQLAYSFYWSEQLPEPSLEWLLAW